MTQKDMYDALLYGCRYKPDGYYPSMRYDKRHDEQDSWWGPVCKDYAKIIKKCIEKDDKMDFNNTKINVDGHMFNAHNIEVTSDYDGTTITASAYLTPSITNAPRKNCTNNPSKPLTIENVIFNPPATIVFWSDHSKTIVKADYDYESYDPEKGIAMAIAKKLMGDNKGKYYELFKHWRNKWDEQNKTKVNVEIPKTPLDTLANNLKKVFSNPAIEGVCTNGEEKD